MLNLCRLAPREARSASARTALQLALVLVAVISGCRADPGAPPSPPSVTGDWRLSLANQHALPYVVRISGSDTTVLVSSRLTFSSNGHWTRSDSTTVRSPRGSTLATVSDAGTWTQAGIIITLASASLSSPSELDLASGTLVGFARIGDSSGTLVLTYVRP